MTDDELRIAFEDHSLPLSALSHRAHVRLAWLYLSRDAFGVAGERFVTALRRYADAHGRTHLFHATLTWAYLALVAERRVEHEPFDVFAERNPDLLDHRGGAIRRLYDEETLDSPRARAVFVLPRR